MAYPSPTFRKASPADPDALAVEAAGLRWLAAATTGGGARVVRVVAEAGGRLDLERIAPARPSAPAARTFGRALAHTHAAGAPWFGCPPPGWSGAGRIGLAPLSLATAVGHWRWGEFYAAERLAPYLRAAVDAGAVARSHAPVIERVLSRLTDGAYDAAQPALVTGPVARVHGDLWSGNVLWDAAAGGEAVLIDPAAHGGHAETDLAMLALFGQAHLDAVLAGYEEVSQLADGWRERMPLHQLHPLLVHAVLFGGGYGDQAVRTAGRC